MNGHKVTMLGTGLIGLFYTRTLHGQRNRDRVEVVYSRSQERAEAFARENDVPTVSTDLEEAIAHPDTDTVVIGLPNHLHLEAVELCAKHGKAVLCTKPLARTGAEAKRILDIAEEAGIFGGYLEDLVYSPKTLKAVAAVQARPDRRRHVGPLPRDAPRPALRVVLGRRAGGRRRGDRPRLPLHRDHPQLRGQGEPARSR